MARSKRTGWKAYVPSVTGVVKILIVLVVLRLVINATIQYVPANFQKFVPNLG